MSSALERPRRASRRRALLALPVLAALAVAIALATRDDVGSGGGPPARPPDLNDLWAGRAAFVGERKWTSMSLGAPGGGAPSGAHIEIVGDSWYLFNRRNDPDACPGHGPALGTQVRRSTDRGATWSPPTTIIAPTAGTPWACAATDGDAVYDAEQRTWRYLFQCMSPGSGWRGCYAERRDPSPLGPFTAPAPDPNPVIAPGQLWGPICDNPGDRCGDGEQPIRDEGTFSLLAADGGGWWVGFHGFDGAQGYRGIARTRTFGRGGWLLDGAGGTPSDAVVDASDAAGWRESWRSGGPIGAGAGSLLQAGDAYFQLVEVPDSSLGCTAGQNWDLGLLRTTDLAADAWEQYPAGNPLVYSSREPGTDGQPPGCNVLYPSLFEDPASGATYLMHGRASVDTEFDGIYLYRLEWNRNMLTNGDFWRADTAGWRPQPGSSTQLEARRVPDASPDGTPYLSFSCGAPDCAGGQSLYHDVPVDGEREGEKLAFGGTFRTESESGRLDMAVLQLDGAGAAVDDAVVVPVEAGPGYRQARGELELDGRTRRLRFELYPRTPGMLRADNLYVIPRDGCETPRYPAC